MFGRITQSIKYQLFTSAKQHAFLEDVASLIEDGVSSNQAIEMMSQIAKGLILELVESVLLALAEGKYFADGMVGWFPAYIVEMIRAGEEGGSLVEAMKNAADALAKRSSVMNSLLSSLTYPLAVVVMGFVVIVFINHSIFTDFRTILPFNEWPQTAQNLVALASFTEHWWWLMLAIIPVLVALIIYILRNYIGNNRKYFDQLPFISLYRDLTAAQFMETLGMLIKNGIVFKYALEILKYNASPYLSSHLLAMEYRLGGGKDNIGEVLDTGLLKDEDIQRLQLIAKGKQFEHALVRLGKRAQEQSIKQIQRNGRVGGGLLLMIGAGLLAFMIFSIYGVGAVIGSY